MWPGQLPAGILASARVPARRLWGIRLHDGHLLARSCLSCLLCTSRHVKCRCRRLRLRRPDLKDKLQALAGDRDRARRRRLPQPSGARLPDHLRVGAGRGRSRHITISEAEVKQRFTQLVHQSFPKAGSLKKYLATSGETEADFLARIKVELLASKIAAQVTAGKSASQHSAILTAFETNFHTHWKALTSCNPGYVMEDCKQYKGKGENLNATPSHSASSSAKGSSAAASPSSSASSSSGEVYTSPGAFSISSPAFERNG